MINTAKEIEQKETSGVAKSALQMAHEAAERGEGVPLRQLVAPFYRREGIAVPIEGNQFNLSMLSDRLKFAIQGVRPIGNERASISAMCVTHFVDGRYFSIDPDNYNRLISDIPGTIAVVLHPLERHIQETNGVGCEVFFRARPPDINNNSGGHGL